MFFIQGCLHKRVTSTPACFLHTDSWSFVPLTFLLIQGTKIYQMDLSVGTCANVEQTD